MTSSRCLGSLLLLSFLVLGVDAQQLPDSPAPAGTYSSSNAAEPAFARRVLPVQVQTGPHTAPPVARYFLDDDTYFSTVFVGGGASVAGPAHVAGAHLGAAAGAQTLGAKPGGVGSMQFLEVGAMGPLADRPAPAWFVGYDLGATLRVSRDPRVVPFAVGGYSYIFSQASAINFGVGVDLHYETYRAIRVEVRDYYTFTQAPGHNVAVRVGWVFSTNNP